jgi:hypothetical protein
MLWLIQVINLVAVICISYFETGLIADMVPEESGLALAAYFFLFALLIWLVFSLTPTIGRWVHIVFGALTVLLKGSYIVQSLGGVNSIAFLLNEVWGAVAAAVLVWVAWRLPKTGSATR